MGTTSTQAGIASLPLGLDWLNPKAYLREAIPGYAHYDTTGPYIQQGSAANRAGVANDVIPGILGYGLAGLGLGLSGTRLYQIIRDNNKAKQKHVKFSPGAQSIDDEEALVSEKKSNAVLDFLASIPKAIADRVPVMPSYKTLSARQQEWIVPATLGTTAAGIFGGNQLMSAIYENKREEERKEQLEEAKGEYQRALTGKRAEALDAAYGKYCEKKASLPGLLASGYDWLLEPMRRFGPKGLTAVYNTAVLGTGALAGKMTYDWTKERSAAKAIERARKARARLNGTAPVYVDPEQLAAIKELADKRMNA